MSITLMSISTSNTSIITDNSEGQKAYYAAEAALEKVKNIYNTSPTNWQKTATQLYLPDSETNAEELNGAQYWVDSIEYTSESAYGDIDIAKIKVVGKYGNTYRKLRARISFKMPDIFGDYGLLSNGTISISGAKKFEKSIHGNQGLSIAGNPDWLAGAVGTQSSDPNNTAFDYVPTVNVPKVPVEDLADLASGGRIIYLDETTDLYTDIMTAYEEGIKYIYVSPSRTALHPNPFVAYAKTDETTTTTTTTTPSLSLRGDMHGMVIYINGDYTLDIGSISQLQNVMVVSSGSLSINGSGDIGTAHSGKLDVIIACNGDVNFNGARDFEDIFFWTNGTFRQNGNSSVSKGVVISQGNLTLNGNFQLYDSGGVAPNDGVTKVAYISSVEQISIND